MESTQITSSPFSKQLNSCTRWIPPGEHAAFTTDRKTVWPSTSSKTRERSRISRTVLLVPKPKTTRRIFTKTRIIKKTKILIGKQIKPVACGKNKIKNDFQFPITILRFLRPEGLLAKVKTFEFRPTKILIDQFVAQIIQDTKIILVDCTSKNKDSFTSFVNHIVWWITLHPLAIDIRLVTPPA